MSSIWRILVIDDDVEILQQISEYLNGHDLGDEKGILEIECISDFDQAQEELRKKKFDLIILDVRCDQTAGTQQDSGIVVYNKIKEICFIPILFYTGLPGSVESLTNSAIKVISKDEGVEEVLNVVEKMINDGIPSVHKSLIEHVEDVQREYMWKYFVDNWEGFGEINDKTDLAYLLTRRLSTSFSYVGIKELSKKLKEPILQEGEEGSIENEGEVSNKLAEPMHYYIIPPIEKLPLSGDLYKGIIEELDGYWVLLTPSCDFWQNKAEYVLLAHCSLIESFREYQKWCVDSPSKAAVGDFKSLISNRKNERYFFLPGVLTQPDMFIDFQDLKTIAVKDLEALHRIASIDSMFASEINGRFIRYFGRRGTPDINFNFISDRLIKEKEKVQ
ncbi:response regulator [Peribacillus simplex]|uniref:response regulator n=1 Tax=Peribacillus simplex TaxID=1478 RepID=UPI00366FA548